CGFALSVHGGRWLAALGGLVVGSAIGSMHYLGMHALIVPGVVSWNLSLVIASLVIGSVFAMTALLAFQRNIGLRGIVPASGFLVLAICGLHFTAMGAATISIDPTLWVQGNGLDRSYLALAVAGVTFVVLLSAFAAAAIQRTN